MFRSEIMPKPNSLISIYEDIAEITSCMRDFAAKNEWESLLELAPKYHDAVQKLRKLGDMPNTDLNQRRDLLLKIIEDDAQVRNLIQPRLKELDSLINNLQRQQTVLSTYYEPQT